MNDSLYRTDAQLISLIKRELFTSVIGDVMDGMGLTHQFLPPRIRPLRPDMVVCGRAMTVQEADCASSFIAAQDREAAFGLMFEALDSLKENDVYLAAGAGRPYANWGELMSTRAIQLKAAGAVVDGFSRDTNGILELNFPTFSSGLYGQDQSLRGRVIDYNCPLEFSNQTRVDPGDLVLGDIDGVLVVPRGREEEVIGLALEKVRGENRVRDAILDGMSATEAWERFGIL